MASAPNPHPSDDLDIGYAGQRQLSFRFDLIDGRYGARRGTLTPLRGTTPTLSHDTTATISRRISNLTLHPADAALIDPLTDRIDIRMVTPGGPAGGYPLGRYMVADAVTLPSSGGTRAQITLYDEMFLIDQDLDTGFDAAGRLADTAIRALLDDQPITDPVIDPTDVPVTTSWSAGTSRAAALLDLATAGGYFKPWFDHTGRLRVMRGFDPADQPADLVLDGRVLAASITRSPQLLAAPNRFVVVSNDPAAASAPIVGTWDVPASAPHSITARGYVIPTVVEAQLANAQAAAVYARTLGLQQTVYEVAELSTPPDPRHDSYQVIGFDGQLWLETGWEMPLAAGGAMRHTLRRVYGEQP